MGARFTAQGPRIQVGLLCNCGFSPTGSPGHVCFEVPLGGASLAEVFNAALCKQTARSGKLSEKISAGLGMGFLKFFLKSPIMSCRL